ncbi:hypothetical protein IMSAGC019_02118 [Lachnospiraceae bacterium]|nr:hypothetical protein IMSAGC019_02118 [Lachnospiraceae bacterium]
MAQKAGIPGFPADWGILGSGGGSCREYKNKLLGMGVALKSGLKIFGGIMNNDVLEFQCIGMDNGSRFPIEYTGRGQDISPEFLIKNLSPNAKTLAVTLEDLSHPVKDFTHWIIWNIPAADKIEGNIPAGKVVPMLGNARQGIGYGLHRYAGPKPPKEKKHIYRFTVYSLDCEINISANSTKRNFLKKAEMYIIQRGSISGEFE